MWRLLRDLRGLVPPLPRRVWLLLLGESLFTFSYALTLAFLLIYVGEVKGLGMTVAGLSLTCFAAGTFVGMPVSGHLADRIGARRILIASVLLVGAATFGLIFVNAAWQAWVVASVLGVADGAAMAPLMTVIAQATAGNDRAGAFAVRSASANAAAGLGIVTGGFVLNVSRPATFDLVYTVAAGACVAFALLVIVLRLGGSYGGSDTAERDAPGAGEGDDDAAEIGSSSRHGYLAVLKDRAFVPLVAFVAVMALADGSMQLATAFPGYVVAVGESTRAIGIAFAVNTLVNVLLQLPVLRLLRGRRRTRVLGLACGLSGVSWIIVLCGGLVASAVATPVFAIGLGVFALAEVMVAPSMAPLVNDLASDDLRGRYNAAYGTAAGIGDMAGPALAGVVLAAGGRRCC